MNRFAFSILLTLAFASFGCGKVNLKCSPGKTSCAGGCTDVTSDARNCGACGNACSDGQACTNGACSCTAGLTACGTTCTDPQTDATNCGACGNACAAGAICTDGVCGCPTGKSDCSGSCADLQNDAANCGTCGNACPNGDGCVNGSCGCGTLSTCNATCVNEQTDNSHCGSCTTVCGVGHSCQAGQCKCVTAGQSDCGGTCVSEQTDNNNCGACGVVCSGGKTCVAGACTCPAGQTDCSGTCVNEQTDSMHCGTCATVCAGGKSCVAGGCVCPAGQTDCSGTCVNEQTDNSHCGTCTTVCSGGHTCTTGTCQCGTGLTDCTGTCVNEQTDNNHCGGCSTVCSGGMTCQAGTCKCPSGQTNCGGTCAVTTSDRAHCGSTCAVCSATQLCNNGSCVTAPAAAFATNPPWGDPTGWTDSSSAALQASLLPTGITGLTYQCRTGSVSTIATLPFASCDGASGTTAVDKPAAGADGSMETDYRYIQGAYTSNTVTYQFYAHSSLNGVAKCAPKFTDAQYVTAAQNYATANPTKFTIPATPLFTGDANLKLRNPFIVVPFKGVSESIPMGFGGWPATQPFDFTTKDLSLRHRYSLSADAKLLILKRNFAAMGTNSCINMGQHHGHGYRSPITQCDAFVVNIKGQGLCMSAAGAAPAVVNNTDSAGAFVSGWNMIRTIPYGVGNNGIRSTNLCTTGNCNGAQTLLPP